MAISLMNAIIKSASRRVDKDSSSIETLKDSSFSNTHDTAIDEQYVNMCTRRISFSENVEVKVVKRLYSSEKKRRNSFYDTVDFMIFNMESKKKV